jgi:hypothetical protein
VAECGRISGIRLDRQPSRLSPPDRQTANTKTAAKIPIAVRCVMLPEPFPRCNWSLQTDVRKQLEAAAWDEDQRQSSRDSSQSAQRRVCAARFAPDSPLEGTGFEPSVPRKAPGVPAVSVIRRLQPAPPREEAAISARRPESRLFETPSAAISSTKLKSWIPRSSGRKPG